MTAGVHTFGYRSVIRHGASDIDAGSVSALSSRSMSWISYAFDSCAMMRQRNGDVNDGIAAISTRHRLPGAGGDGGDRRGHESITGAVADGVSHNAGSVGPNSRGAICSA